MNFTSRRRKLDLFRAARRSPASRIRRWRQGIEALEQRLLLATTTVTNAANDDPGDVVLGDLMGTSSAGTANVAQIPPLMLIGQIAASGAADAVRFGNLVYVAGSTGINVFNVSDPANPQFIRNFGTAAGNLEIRGDRLVAIRGGNTTRLSIYSLASDPENPTLLGATAELRYSFSGDLLLTDTHAYVTTLQFLFLGPATNADIIAQSGDLLSIDISNPAAPFLDDVLINTFGTNNDGMGVAGGNDQSGGPNNVFMVEQVDANTLYIGTTTSAGGTPNVGTGRILVVDISNPTNMTVIAASELQIPGTVQLTGLAIDGDRAFVVGSSGGWTEADISRGLSGSIVLATVDITDSRAPQLIYSQTLARRSRGLGSNFSPVAPDLYAFGSLGDPDDPELILLDTSDPLNLAVSETDVTSERAGLSGGDGLIYTASADGLSIFEIGTTSAMLSISATSATKLEGHSPGAPGFTFTVTRTDNTSGATSVDYAVTGSGANPANAADFGGAFPSGTVSFLATETAKTITVNINGDTTVEADERFTVTLSNPSANATITTASANGTIRNDDVSPPVLVIVDALGNLMITDVRGVNNNITVTRNTTTNEFIVTSTTNQLTANGITATNNVHIPVASVTRGLIANLRQGNDRLTLTGLSLRSTVQGGDGNDTITGGASSDLLSGGNGNDSLNGNSGNDTLNGENGNDKLTGGLGADRLTGGNGSDRVVETANANITLTNGTLVIGTVTDTLSGIESANLTGGSGNNTLTTSAFTLGAVTLSGGSGNDSLVGTNLADLLIAGSGRDTLFGRAGHDTLYGGLGNDTLNGGDGNDAMLGQDGSDSLLGGAGNDTMIGGAGNDTLKGGLLNDALIGGFGSDSVNGEAGTDTALGGQGGPARGGTGVADPGDTIVAELIDEAFATVFPFE